MRGHRMTPASRAPPPPFPPALSEPVCTSREPNRPRCGPETSPAEAVGKLGQAGVPPPGEGQGGGAGFQSPRNLAPGNPESEQETPMQGELAPEA